MKTLLASILAWLLCYTQAQSAEIYCSCSASYGPYLTIGDPNGLQFTDSKFIAVARPFKVRKGFCGRHALEPSKGTDRWNEYLDNVGFPYVNSGCVASSKSRAYEFFESAARPAQIRIKGRDIIMDQNIRIFNFSVR
jgi:hypothetical protein